MIKFFITAIPFVLTACSLHADVTPDGNILEDAIVGVPYTSDINIIGGAAYSLESNGKERFIGEISVPDIGLSLKYCNDSPSHNCVRVQGIPLRPGVVAVRVSGGLFGTNIATGGEFDKTYTITIKKLAESS